MTNRFFVRDSRYAEDLIKLDFPAELYTSPKDCEYRYVEDGTLCCKNKQSIETDLSCDNCTGNIHLNCDNYNAKKDLCLKWFETEVSKNYKDCSEKSVFNDKELSRKWSN